MNSRITLIFLIVLIASISLNAQNAYYDALQLSKETDVTGKLNKNSKVASILDNYFQPETTNTPSQIYDGFDPTPVTPSDPNPFIQFTSPAHSVVPFSSVKSSIESIGGLNVTNLADGLAQFLIKRANQELNILFFDKFKQDITGSAELKLIFPKTYEILKLIEPLEYARMINLLREAFRSDLSNIIVNLQGLPKIDKYETLFKEHPAILLALRASSIV
uniref:hypothetical protein n=1 Tax=Fulvivirga sp. TaxID=1931237 RepID=UPI00404B85CB